MVFTPLRHGLDKDIFLWLKKNVPVPTQTHGDNETWFRAQPWKATAVAQRSTPRHYNQPENCRETPYTCLGVNAQTSNHGHGEWDQGRTNHPLAFSLPSRGLAHRQESRRRGPLATREQKRRAFFSIERPCVLAGETTVTMPAQGIEKLPTQHQERSLHNIVNGAITMTATTPAQWWWRHQRN